MRIKQIDTKLLFSFYESKLNYEFGMMLINQLPLSTCIVGAKSMKRGKEGYLVETKDYVSLEKILPKLSETEILKTIYDLFWGIKNIEESGLLNKYCLWCKYNHLFFDENLKQIKYIVLPVSTDQRYEDYLKFEERLMESVVNICTYTSETIQKQIIDAVSKYLAGNLLIDEILKTIKVYVSFDSSIVLDDIHVINRELKLIYIEGDDSREYQMKKDEIIIGKTIDRADFCLDNAEAVSRVHCKIIRQNNNYFVQDMDSLNHTQVNGEFVPPFELMELEDMDLLTLGDAEIRINIVETVS